MTPIRAVIFDMDGVLIDSEPVYLRHEWEQLHIRYPWITPESLYPTIGMASQDYMPFMARLCRRENDEAFAQELHAMSTSCQVCYPEILNPQVHPVLARLRSMGLQIALASSSSRSNIQRVLETCRLTDAFDVLVSGESFTRSKPDPEIYRYTMGRLGRQPEECLIVEDSTYGVQAGAAAGGIVAALRDDRFPFDQRAAHLHIEQLTEIPALVACGGRKIRAAFFDVDGTLIASGTHAMPGGIVEALTALRRRGVAVLLCTGRHKLEIEEENLLPGLTWDGAAYMNGQLCEWQGHTVQENWIPAGDLRELRRFLQQRGKSCIFLEKNCMYANRVDARMERGQEQVGTAVPKVRGIDDLETRKIDQAIPYIAPEEEAELLARMPNCQIKRWSPFAVDLISREGGKQNGIRALCTAMGISPEETIAFGDAENDLEMLRLAGIGVAMGNALPQVRDCADYVTGTVEQGGVVEALHHFQLIEER